MATVKRFLQQVYHDQTDTYLSIVLIVIFVDVLNSDFFQIAPKIRMHSVYWKTNQFNYFWS